MSSKLDKIQFQDKDDLNKFSTIAEINKITADNVNEIKNVVNATVEAVNTVSENLENNAYASVPIGCIIEWFGTDESIPNNFLALYGQELSREDYASLFKAIGTKYGSGNGSSTFNLPNQNAGIDDEEIETNMIPKFTYIMRVQ